MFLFEGYIQELSQSLQSGMVRMSIRIANTVPATNDADITIVVGPEKGEIIQQAFNAHKRVRLSLEVDGI